MALIKDSLFILNKDINYLTKNSVVFNLIQDYLINNELTQPFEEFEIWYSNNIRLPADLKRFVFRKDEELAISYDMYPDYTCCGKKHLGNLSVFLNKSNKKFKKSKNLTTIGILTGIILYVTENSTGVVNYTIPKEDFDGANKISNDLKKVFSYDEMNYKNFNTGRTIQDIALNVYDICSLDVLDWLYVSEHIKERNNARNIIENINTVYFSESSKKCFKNLQNYIKTIFDTLLYE